MSALTHTMAIRRLRAAVKLYRNDDTHSEDLAANAAFEQRAAWWLSVGYSSTSTTMIVDDLNKGIDIEIALARYYILDDKQMLDRLVPLNREAVNDLLDAYKKRGVVYQAEDVDTRHALRFTLPA